MAKHGFGIMEREPLLEDRFEKYEPEQYHCIFVEDDILFPYLDEIQKLKLYWHTKMREEKGLCYCGITLLPPSAFPFLREIFSHEEALKELSDVLQKAEKDGKFVIHFGI